MNKRVIVMELLLKWFHYKQILFFPEDGTYLVGILIFSFILVKLLHISLQCGSS